MCGTGELGVCHSNGSLRVLRGCDKRKDLISLLSVPTASANFHN